MKIHEEFACVGYFGFGSGVHLHRDQPGPNVDLYCNVCPVSAQCWPKHRERVRRIVPDLMKLLDDLAATGLMGGALIRAYAAKVAKNTGHDPSTIAPPEVHVMTGNIEDGASVAAGQPPKNRGEFSLRYPFES